MNYDYFSDAYEHRKLSGELHDTPWWQALMADPRFHAAYDRNLHARTLMADSAYLKNLLRSESARQSFIEEVFHPAPDHLATPED